MDWAGAAMQPIQGWGCAWSHAPGVARRAQPRAERCNPFGIGWGERCSPFGIGWVVLYQPIILY